MIPDRWIGAVGQQKARFFIAAVNGALVEDAGGFVG